MFLFILSIILVIVAIIAIAYGFAQEEGAPKVAGLGMIIVAIALFIFSCIGIVPTGYTGILTTFGAVQDRTVSAGINFVAPWQDVITMDNRTQKVEISTQAFSSDIQQVDISMSVNYCIGQETARELYKTVGKNYYENIMFPRIQENVKAVFSQYTAEALIANREILSSAVADLMKNDMSQYGITIISIAIEDIDFTDAFTNAVEAKQVAAQNKLTAETQQAQKTMEQEAEAERAIIAANAKAQQDIIAAQADLEVVKIQADAALYAGEREANMNERIAAALSDELINYYWIKQWDGKLPSTVLGGDNSFMIDLTE
jgi:regulator of protease activity HflC (stomatin/prohibitin superfamily)